MAKGVYIRTKPKSKKQMQQIRELGQKPKTQNQLRATRQNVKKAQKKAQSVPRTKAQRKAVLENIKDVRVFADTIVKHHNDLCHGAKDPDDVTYMTSSEHMRLHANIRIFLLTFLVAMTLER